MRHERIASAAPKGSPREYSHTGTAPLGSAASSECGLAGMRTRQRRKCAVSRRPRARQIMLHSQGLRSSGAASALKHLKGQAGWSALARGSENSAAIAVTRGRQRAAPRQRPLRCRDAFVSTRAARTFKMQWRECVGVGLWAEGVGGGAEGEKMRRKGRIGGGVRGDN